MWHCPLSPATKTLASNSGSTSNFIFTVDLVIKSYVPTEDLKRAIQANNEQFSTYLIVVYFILSFLGAILHNYRVAPCLGGSGIEVGVSWIRDSDMNFD